jgi:hypothetical protein
LGREALHTFKVLPDGDIVGRPNFEDPEHEGSIVSLSVSGSQRLIVTAGTDNIIKVRTFYKVLVYQIMVAPALNYAFFVGDTTSLVISNGGQLWLCRGARISLDFD